MSRVSIIVLIAALVLAGGAVAYRMLADGADHTVPVVVEAAFPPTIEALKTAAEADPLNPGPWQELGFAYYQTEQYEEAARAYRQAVEGDKENAVLWSSLGEARLMATDSSEMPANAVSAFEKALELDPTDARARYFLAVKKDLARDHEGAITDWLALLEDTPPGAPWENNLRQTIEQIGKINNIEVAARIAAANKQRPAAPPAQALTAGNAIPGPSWEQIAAAGAIAPGEQRDMAVSMVESLDAKLRANPANPDGWVMLMRSRMTLGEPDKASQALKDAIAGNPGDASRLRKEAAALRIE
ncbi:tetratricopeptide repeat protein [Altererythrobacter aestiaquae]|uniref:Tetratricopeptide repeat protein n=2 Tax=Pontixanthobacter aestiaquae TaxID=1509367 RepID=A0A844Z693_9SPHN|nr:tetratricopeptide repeat protein [Pontixanthobacter aestiaquae]